jgi:O-acetylserine/cysteine efflux transporter
MTMSEALRALVVAFAWGLGFVAMKYGDAEMSPLMLSAWRFIFAAFPAVFFLRPPKTRVWIVFAYGLAIGVAQFSLLFIAISLGMPAGLSSLLMQTQVIFTVLFAWMAMGERPMPFQIVGVAIALVGLGVIASVRAGGGAAGPFAMVIAAAAAWAVGNIFGKMAGRVDMLAFTAWSSLVSPPFLIALSFIFEGREALAAIVHPAMRSLLAAAFLGYVATVLGYSLWAGLLSRHPAAAVGPFSLLVPVFGFLAAWIAFGETIGGVEFAGAALILIGVGWNVLGGRAMRYLRGPPTVG